jgi:peptide-methionine (S)-S-oxide reductase
MSTLTDRIFTKPTQHRAPRSPSEAQQPPEGAERATFAAGCFWGVEAAFRDVDGVLETAVGYTGGDRVDPSYEQVCRGDSGHAEAVEVWFDPGQVSYEQLIETFWRMHNPTTANRQGWDVGSQYRSAIYFHDPHQRELAIGSRENAQSSLRKPITTEITPVSEFYRAEDYHQRYFERQGRAARAVTLR